MNVTLFQNVYCRWEGSGGWRYKCIRTQHVALKYVACITMYSSIVLMLQMCLSWIYFSIFKTPPQGSFSIAVLYLDKLLYAAHIFSVRCNISSKRNLHLFWWALWSCGSLQWKANWWLQWEGLGWRRFLFLVVCSAVKTNHQTTFKKKLEFNKGKQNSIIYEDDLTLVFPKDIIKTSLSL